MLLLHIRVIIISTRSIFKKIKIMEEDKNIGEMPEMAKETPMETESMEQDIQPKVSDLKEKIKKPNWITWAIIVVIIIIIILLFI